MSQTAVKAPLNEYQKLLLRLKDQPHALQVSGFRGDKPLADAITADLTEFYGSAGSDEALKKAGELMKMRADGDGAAARELCSIRTETSNNFLIPKLRLGAALFDIETLAPGERAAYLFESINPNVTVLYTGLEGGVPFKRIIKEMDGPTYINLDLLWTDAVRYPIRDWYNQNVVQSALKTVDLAWSMAKKIDALLLAQVNLAVGDGGLFGTFTVTGSKPSRVYVPDDVVSTGNLPTTNDITIDATHITSLGLTGTMTANSTTTGFREDVFRVMIGYETAWGDLFGGPLFTGEILIPSSDVIQISKDVTIAGARGSDLKEQMAAVGFANVDFLGRNYKLIPDVTLPKNVCYPVPAKKPGVMFLRPDMDDEDVTTDKRKGFESRALGKAFGCYLPVHKRIQALRIRYRTAS